MRRLFPALLAFVFIAAASTAMAQPTNRSAELDKAVEDTRTAYIALQDAEKRRNEEIESLPGERQGSAAGGSRPTDEYRGRQAQLEMDVVLARRRYEAALKRWNDLK